MSCCHGYLYVKIWPAYSSFYFKVQWNRSKPNPQWYSKTCLSRTPSGLKNMFTLDRCLVYTGSNYIHLVDETVKSVWFRQVFSLLRVRFRSVSLYFKIKATISWPNFYTCLKWTYSSVLKEFGLDRFYCISYLYIFPLIFIINGLTMHDTENYLSVWHQNTLWCYR
jgi:hypothetical protein